MSTNPVVSIGTSITTPTEPGFVRASYARVVFQEQSFFTYAQGEWDYDVFNPQGKGEHSFFFLPLGDTMMYFVDDEVPDFISADAWNNSVSQAPSGFVTSVNSIMPKLMVPSDVLVDNGACPLCVGTMASRIWYSNQGSGDSPSFKTLFNWHYGSLPAQLTSYGEAIQWSGSEGARYVTTKFKNDTNKETEAELVLLEPGTNEVGEEPPDGPWNSDYGGDYKLVGVGAFMLMLNVTPMRPAKANPRSASKNKWQITITLGSAGDPSVEMVLQDTGALSVVVAGEEDGNITKCQLAESKAKEQCPQQQHIVDKQPYVLVVYPVWNGIIVSSGVQDARNLVSVSSQFCPKLKGASILSDTYSTPFDPKNPDEVLVGTGSGATDVKVDFTNALKVDAKNCLVDICYLPLFFTHRMWMDEWFLTESDVEGTVAYSYYVYPIWTKNGTDAAFNPDPEVLTKDKPGETENTEYKLVQWDLEMAEPSRWAGEIFGYYLRTEESRDYVVDNNNGSFALEWTRGTPGDPSPSTSWVDYITNVQSSIGLEGSSGSMTVDKFGIAGQEAVATQSIGALEVTVNDTSMPGTTPGKIFSGLGMGISDQQSADGAQWNIPMFGLEKKLEDIILINVPFFDGYLLYTVLNFLTRYGGIVADYSYAPHVHDDEYRLPSSEDVSSPAVDFKTGTTLLDALNQVMEWMLHWYVIRDGKIYFYELDPDDGLPINSVYSGLTDWEPFYPFTKIQNVDQNPDFDDLRNELVVVAMQMVKEGKGSDITDIPLMPRISTSSQTTVPTVPWSKPILQGLNGYMTEAEMSEAIQRLKATSKRYFVTGRTTIPGNADIKPYDRWADYVITSVSHNVDLQSKTWTTDLEFATGRS